MAKNAIRERCGSPMAPDEIHREAMAKIELEWDERKP